MTRATTKPARARRESAATVGQKRKTVRAKTKAVNAKTKAVRSKTAATRQIRTSKPSSTPGRRLRAVTPKSVSRRSSGAAKRNGKAPKPLAAVPKPAPVQSEDRPALTPRNSSREECLKRYLPLVRYVVERVAAGIPRHVDHEDLISAGVLGLLNAYDKFDSGKGTKFETYAVWRIRGAVLDQLRSLDWASRSTRRMGREMESTARALDQKLGRTATDQEIARAMQIKLDDYYRLMDRVRGSALVSLDETRHGEEGDTLGLAELLEDPRTPDVLATLEQEEAKSFLHTTLNRLPEQERLVMALYYYEQMTLREIGEALGISESRVSQIHTRAVERLRGRVHRALAS
jgi:RNA polymerase sigma factor for flagellar operon FliA